LQIASPACTELEVVMMDWLGKMLDLPKEFLASTGGKGGGVIQVNTNLYIYIYTGCPRRNVPDFGRVFLMVKYTDITQNTYVQS
jgi:hypothetical protein